MFLAVMFGGLHRGISKKSRIDVLKNEAISLSDAAIFGVL
jgi:hypothetical protein